MAGVFFEVVRGDRDGARDGMAGPVSRDKILRREREKGNVHFLCSADHEQD